MIAMNTGFPACARKRKEQVRMGMLSFETVCRTRVRAGMEYEKKVRVEGWGE